LFCYENEYFLASIRHSLHQLKVVQAAEYRLPQSNGNLCHRCCLTVSV